MKAVYVARTYEEKAMQRALMQFSYPQNYELVKKALRKAGREDLIGYLPHCLIAPRNMTQRPKHIKKQREGHTPTKRKMRG